MVEKSTRPEELWIERCELTFPSLWRARSTQREMKTIMQQTTATIHVGVYSREWLSSSAMFALSLTKQLFLFNIYFGLKVMVVKATIFYMVQNWCKSQQARNVSQLIKVSRQINEVGMHKRWNQIQSAGHGVACKIYW